MRIQPIKDNDHQLQNIPATHNADTGHAHAEEMQLNEFVATIINARWFVVSTTALLLLTGIIYIFLVTPIYRADVLIQVEQKHKASGALAEFSELLKEQAPVSEVFEILRSRMVLGPVVENLKLDLVAQPAYFPIIGKAVSRRHHPKEQIADPLFNLNSYAWGGEAIRVERFDVPIAYQGQQFELVTDGDMQFQMFGPEGELVTNGAVGTTVEAVLDGEHRLAIFVSELAGRPGTRYTVTKKNKFAAIDELKASLKIAELGMESGILQMSIDGADREKITTILNEVANTYLRKTVELKSEETEKTLSFLNEQLPILKVKMEEAEDALNLYRLRRGSIDLPKETSVTLDKVVSIEAQLTELRRNREELIRKFTPSHPRIVALDAQINSLTGELQNVDSKLRTLPATQQEILRLTRDMEVSSTLYLDLLNSAQELKILKAGTAGNVRVIDYALTPYTPVKPKKGLVLVLTATLGMLVGIAITFLRKNLSEEVQDPDVIERKLGIPVYATVPHSKSQAVFSKSLRSDTKCPLLALNTPHDFAIESLRSLRTSLYFARPNLKNNLILITSPGPNAGKSFVSANLAAVLAGPGRKTLLIDADLRKGAIHDVFGMSCQTGLSDIILHNIEFERAIHQTEINYLYVVPTGEKPAHPSELLLHERFIMALETFNASFDYIIIDSPPILAVTDAAIIGRLSGATLLVVKDKQSPLREIANSIKRLKQTGINVKGIVYNDLKSPKSHYGYGKYYGYAYSYKYTGKKKHRPHNQI